MPDKAAAHPAKISDGLIVKERLAPVCRSS